jgi:hypothetical protein
MMLMESQERAAIKALPYGIERVSQEFLKIREKYHHGLYEG